MATTTSPEDLDSALHALLWYFGHDEFYRDVVKPWASLLSKPWLSTMAVVALGGLGVGCFGIPVWNAKCKRQEYRRAIEQAQERREDEIESVRQQIRDCQDDARIQEVVQIILEGPMTVYRKLQDGSITPRQAVLAYYHHMIIAQDKTNCLTNVLTDALEQAQTLEKEYLGKPKPKLYGVVFSLKDMYNVKGRDSTVGLAKYLNQPKEQDCVLLQVLKHHGAIVIAKTGCPQTLLSYGSGNPIYGTVNNPNSLERCAGGSSSGEGAILALNGAMAGAGSDLGGSLRTPANFCGICTLRPMNGRLSPKGVLECIEGYRGIESTRGFLARDVEMLALCYATVLSDVMFRLDPEVPPIPWRQDMYASERPLRIGYFTEDSFFTPTPGVKRAVEQTVKGLRSIGHTLVPFEDLDAWRLMRGYNKLLLQDRGVQLLDQLYAEDVDACVAPVASLVGTINSNYFARQKLLLSHKFSSRLAYETVQALSSLARPVDVMKTFAERDIYRTKFIESWKALGLDALVCPTTGVPAVPPDVPPKLIYAVSYTRRFNYLDLPAGVVPVTVENEADQQMLEDYRQDDEAYVLAKKAVKGAIGMPIGVQCVALPFQEEMALRVMRDVQNTAGKEMFMRPPLLTPEP